MDSLEFSKPGVSDDGPQYRCEIAEASKGMVDGSRQVLVPVQVGHEVERQQRCKQTQTWPVCQLRAQVKPYMEKNLICHLKRNDLTKIFYLRSTFLPFQATSWSATVCCYLFICVQ